MDESDDEIFYEQPRLVTHIDDKAIAALTAYYAKEIAPVWEWQDDAIGYDVKRVDAGG